MEQLKEKAERKSNMELLLICIGHGIFRRTEHCKLLPHLIVAAGCAFAGCAVIDYMRQMFLERPLQKILRKAKLPIIIKKK